MLKTNPERSCSSSKIFILFTISITLWVYCKAADTSTNKHQKFILSGVTTVLHSRFPGTVSLISEKAFPVLSGATLRALRPHVAGTEYGTGRIVSYSHSTFLILDDLPTGFDNIALFLNSINWTRRNQGRRFGMPEDENHRIFLTELMPEHGFEVQLLSCNDLNNSTHLEQFDVLAISSLNSTVDIEILRTYVRNGGGLVIGATPWSADNVYDMESFWANDVLKDTGIFYIGRHYSYATMDCEGGCFNTSLEYLRDTHAVHVWNDFKQYNWNEVNLPRERLTQIMEILSDRFQDGPTNDTLNGEVNLQLNQIPTFEPTEADPVTEEYQKYFMLAHGYLSLILNWVGLTSDIPPHPASESFPGVSIESLTGATSDTNQRLAYLINIDASLPTWTEGLSLEELERRTPKRTIIFDGANDDSIENYILETVKIDSTRIRWHSTGLYAQPGEEIRIRVLNGDESISDLDVQVGAHTDDIAHHPSWKRSPLIAFRNKIRNNTATIANPFGGPIYIISSVYRNVSLQVSIEGGIHSPTYFLGKTNLNQWRNGIMNNSAPWGELVGRKLIITTQTSLLSQLDNPEEVIALWDRIMDAMADLAAISRERVWPERFVADVQISAGYMHSGYPIMYLLEVQLQSLNITTMTQDPSKLWGFLHELGHNHQQGVWTFHGTVEVTCNVFALNVMHTVFHYPTNKSHSQLTDEAVAERLIDYIENGKQYSVWQSEPWLALTTYTQLQETYGWFSYQRVFAQYHLLTENEHPQNDQEKIDLWMVMFSRVVGENLAPFFISWGFPLTPEAIARVDHLPGTELRIPDPTEESTQQQSK